MKDWLEEFNGLVDKAVRDVQMLIREAGGVRPGRLYLYYFPSSDHFFGKLKVSPEHPEGWTLASPEPVPLGDPKQIRKWIDKIARGLPLIPFG